MSRRRWAGVAIAVLLLLPVLAAGVVLARFDPNDLQPALKDAVRNATGRELRLPDGLHLSWTPRPRLEADAVSLDNIPGGSRPDMAHADRIAVEVEILPLLQRRIVVSRLDLTGPNILFETAKGRPNWRFDQPDQPDVPPPATAEPWALSIRGTIVRNGMVTWRLPARTKVLGIRTMEVRHESEGGPIEWEGTYVYADNAPFRFTGSALPTAGISAPWNTRLDVTAFDTQASATGTMDTAGIYDLQIEARSGTLDKLNALLPEMRLPALRSMEMSARIGNGRQPGDFPAVGASSLRFASMGPSPRFPGLELGASSITIDKPGGTATIQAAGRYAGPGGSQGFSLAGTAAVPLHPDEATGTGVDLHARSAAPGAARFDLGIKGTVGLKALDYAGLDAALHLAYPALATLRGLFPTELPALTDVQFDGQVKLPVSGSPVSFSAARFRSKQGNLSGSGTVRSGTALDVQGKFTSDRLDLDAVLDAFGISLAPAAGQNRGGGIPDRDLAWFALRGPKLDLDLAVAALRFGEEDWRGVDLGLTLADGQMARGTLSVQTAGAPVRLSLTADSRPASPPAALTVDAPALPLSLVARYAGLPGAVSGTARVSARLRAQGRSLRDMAATLDGTVLLASVGGQITNAALIALAGPAVEALGIHVPAAGETRLRCLGVQAAFQGGVGRVSPVALESTYLSLAGQGVVDLRRETLDFDLKPFALVSGSPVAVPVKVQGPFNGITGKLDATLTDKLGLFLDGLFGGDDPTACVDAGLLPRR